tara:strand:+ start:1624 stop:2133 length:510 start_codon:yes stop_codon:yes gene_type:complete
MSTVVNKATFQVILSANTPEYDPNEWLINPDIPDAPKRHWRILNGNLRLKTASQIATADAEFLAETKENKKNGLKVELGEALESKYSNDEKLSLLLILQLAVASGNTARVGYVSQLAGWIDQGQDLLYAAQDSVDSAATVEDVENIQLDLSSWLAADPQVVIRTAKGIE